MQKKYFYFNTIILLGFLCINFSSLSSQCDSRYFLDIFEPPTTPTTVEYGKNTKANGIDQTLFMDIYEPEGDDQTCRPVIFMAYGGSFITGSRTDIDIQFMCKEFTKKGYVAIAIDYRLEPNAINLTNPESMIKALVRGVHDGKAAIRYLRQNAIDGDNDYGVDPDQIFFGGVSAGALLGIHLAYMDFGDPLEEEWVGYINDLGGLEGDSGTPGYSSEVSGIINIAGAIGGTDFISEGDVPIISFHSTGDGTVPYMTGFPLGLNSLPPVYGSFHIHNRMQELGIATSLFTYEDNNHPPYLGDQFIIEVVEEIVFQSEAFLYGLVECIDCGPIDTMVVDTMVVDTMVVDTMIVDTMSSIRDLVLLENVNIFPNPTVGVLNVQIERMKSETIEWTLIDQAGKLVDAGIENSNEFALNLGEYSKGFYFLKLQMDDKVSVEKVILE